MAHGKCCPRQRPRFLLAFDRILVDVPEWTATTLRIFIEFVDRKGLFLSVGVILALLPLVAAARAAVDRTRESTFWILWLAGYALLFLSWEPGTIVYRIPDLIALWALATLGLQTMPQRLRLGAMIAWTSAAFAFNLVFVVRPASTFANNPDLVEAIWTRPVPRKRLDSRQRSRRGLHLLFRGTPPGEPALLYGRSGAARTPRRSHEVRRSRVRELRTLEEEGLRAKLERYGLQPVASAPALSMFRVGRAK